MQADAVAGHVLPGDVGKTRWDSDLFDRPPERSGAPLRSHRHASVIGCSLGLSDLCVGAASNDDDAANASAKTKGAIFVIVYRRLRRVPA